MKQKNIFIAIIVVVLLTIVYYYSRYQGMLTVTAFNQSKDLIKNFVDTNYSVSITLYLLIAAIVAGVGLPILIFITLIGGYLFGILPGALLTIIGATAGATVYFLIVRYFLGAYLQERYKEKLKKFNHQIHEAGVYYLIILHLIPTTPFFVSNLLAGLTKLSTLKFILGTSIGIIPATLIYSYAGSQLFGLQGDISFVPTLLKLLGALGLLAVIPLVAQHFIQRKKNQ